MPNPKPVAVSHYRRGLPSSSSPPFAGVVPPMAPSSPASRKRPFTPTSPPSDGSKKRPHRLFSPYDKKWTSSPTRMV